ncbi:DUF2065 family protein [Qingshengfaniella alkalisoli]|uniref:DUF2065 family protein n=1 Tax=Qingshengfaniella alkalisoli TaxID=2599296 RepID=A0A5B8ITN9_9RHOB|nr:DUF2065 family protein [Qingshengfaniella alkalisoli]QDY69582.1 DUF2065 family protein [Qingshengfaniella alkalisoli]
MTTVIWAIGLVLVVEGLVLALAPLRLEEMLRKFAELPIDTRRLIGLATTATGVALLWIFRLVSS